MKRLLAKTIRRQRRKRRIRKYVTGTADRPRLTVFRSHKNIYAQIVDDTKGQTLVAASSLKLAAVQPAAGETKRSTVTGDFL